MSQKIEKYVSALDRRTEQSALTAVPAAVSEGDCPPLTPRQILSLDRRSNMTDGETLRFARSVESAIAAQRASRAQASQAAAAQKGAARPRNTEQINHQEK